MNWRCLFKHDWIWYPYIENGRAARFCVRKRCAKYQVFEVTTVRVQAGKMGLGPVQPPPDVVEVRGDPLRAAFSFPTKES